MNSSSRLIVALDFPLEQQAERLVEQLGATAQYYKVGLQLLASAGPSIVRNLVSAGKDVFLDLKLFEIPSSVHGAVDVAGQLGVTMVTVHASAGSAVLRAAVEAAAPYPQLKIIALTVITSMRDKDLLEVGVNKTVEAQVLALAELASSAGCHGVVASPQEALTLRNALGSELLIVTPGTRPLDENSGGDQARTGTPHHAICSGATHLVIGRPITQALNPLSAFNAICSEIDLSSA